jgi:hypothetical protein
MGTIMEREPTPIPLIDVRLTEETEVGRTYVINRPARIEL